MTGRRPWAGSTRRLRLPADWATPGGLRDQVLLAAGGRVCRLRFDCCAGYATDVDHIKPGDDHSLKNLQPACGPCHQRKSSQEGAAAKPRERRPPEVHPARK